MRAIAYVTSADRLLVPARHDAQVLVFDIGRDTAGLRVVQRPFADGTDGGDLHFEEVVCTAENCLGVASEPDLALAQTALAASAYLAGLCETLLDMTLDYVRTREQFGRPIGSFQALQHRLVDLYLQVRLSRASLQAALDCESDQTAFIIAATAACQRATDTTMACVREAIQMHGAIGYTAESDTALFAWRGLSLAARFGGARAELDTENCAGSMAVGAADTAALEEACDVPSGQDWNAMSDAEFRRVLRAFLAKHYPPALRHLAYQVRWADIRAWHERLVTQGWAAPAWPTVHGGMGLDAGKLLIYIEEFERHGVARAPDQGIVMLGPILFEYGSEAQRETYLRAALTGEHIWCQGYSEPNAGSDLATLSTRAVLDGDEFVVSGQKTWTTHGLDATHMYCLVRTDPQVKPQAGISFLIIELDAPGITVRPIPNLGEHVDFCEVFFDEVRVPVANLVGEINAGWTIAKALLGHERLFVGSPKLCQHALNQLHELGVQTARFDDPVFRDRYTQAMLDVRDLEALYAEFAAIAKSGASFGPDIGLLKIWSTETYQRLSELIFTFAGAGAAASGADPHTGVDAIAHYYNARPAPIYAGSNEIQRNIIAKHVLRLPS